MDFFLEQYEAKLILLLIGKFNYLNFLAIILYLSAKLTKNAFELLLTVNKVIGLLKIKANESKIIKFKSI